MEDTAAGAFCRHLRRHPKHKVYPYLLQNLAVTRPNQAWAMDITYLPMARGFIYLAAGVDWYSRRVLSWKVSTTMGVHFCLDGKGAWRDNVFVERLWRSVKYEEVYLHAYDTVAAARAGLDRYSRFYNTRRPHSSLDRQTPDQLYFKVLPLPIAA